MSGFISFLSIKKITAILFFSAVFVLNLYGQNFIGVVNYLKVDDPANFLAAENEWQKVQKERINEGMIVGWVLYQVMFKTTEDPYNYIALTIFDSFSKLDKGIPESVISAAFPDKNKNERKAIEDKIESSGKLISSGVFHQRLSALQSIDRQSQYYVINEINIKQGKSSEYLKIKDEIYRPVYEEAMLQGNRCAWSLWEKWPGNMKDYQYVDVDGYLNLDQIDNTNFKKYFATVHPGKNMEEIGAEVEKLSTLVNTEMWKVVYRVLK